MAINEIAVLIVFGAVLSGFLHWGVYRCLYSIIDKDKFPILYTPGSLYKFTKMNWFGCVASWIILLPFTFVLQLGGIIKWLFTAGRKSE